MLSVKSIRRACHVAGIAGFASLLPSIASAQTERPFNWTGFYVGAHGGYNWTSTEFPGQNPYVAPPAPCGSCGSPRQTIEGGIVGGQIGANYQMGAIVLGVEADISKAKLNGTVRDGNYLTQTDTIDQTASVRGRVGLAIGRFLPYITAGVTWEHATRNQACPGDPAAVVAGHCKTQGPYDLSQSLWHRAGIWGGGLEYALTNHVSIRLEGLHTQAAGAFYELKPSATGAVANRTQMEYGTTTTRIGVNYRF